jgi:hypothetical protein
VPPTARQRATLLVESLAHRHPIALHPNGDGNPSQDATALTSLTSATAPGCDCRTSMPWCQGLASDQTGGLRQETHFPRRPAVGPSRPDNDTTAHAGPVGSVAPVGAATAVVDARGPHSPSVVGVDHQAILGGLLGALRRPRPRGHGPGHHRRRIPDNQSGGDGRLPIRGIMAKDRSVRDLHGGRQRCPALAAHHTHHGDHPHAPRRRTPSPRSTGSAATRACGGVDGADGCATDTPLRGHAPCHGT